MKLEDLKNSWNEATIQTEKSESINLKNIDQMIQHRYNSRMKKIAYPELIGTIISFSGAIYLGFHFYKLQTSFLQVVGILVLLYLIIAPIVSLILIFQLNQIVDVSKPYIETLKKFAIQKIRFYKFQKYNALFVYILLGLFVILLPPLFGIRPLNLNKYFWALTIFLGYIFLYFFSKWVLKSYRKTLQQAEKLLQELQT
jgi:hypothetical protein